MLSTWALGKQDYVSEGEAKLRCLGPPPGGISVLIYITSLRHDCITGPMRPHMGSRLRLVPKKQLPWVLQMNCYCDYGLSPKPRGFAQANLMSRLTHPKILLLSETLSRAPSTTCDPHDQLPQRLHKRVNVSMLSTGPHREGSHLLDPKKKGHTSRVP